MDGRPSAWLDSIGATIHFPVGDDGASLRHLDLWLKPIARGQRVSIFLDETLLRTMPLKSGMERYRLPLPAEGLSPGEHSLRFWFRFTRWRGKRRTPAAFGGVRFLPDAPDPPWPEAWTGAFTGSSTQGPALFAAPPLAWAYHLLPPAGARLFAKAAVSEGPPVDFVVRIEEDGQPAAELRRVTVQGGSHVDLDISLEAYAERPVRLSLRTEGEGPGPITRAAWVEPQLLRPALPRSEIPPVKNVVLWVVDGLRSDRVGLGRGGVHAATPNIDLLAREGAAATGVWTGGATSSEGHRRLLAPNPNAKSLPQLMAAAERRTGLLTASSAVEQTLADQFSTRLDLRRAGEPAESSVILRELAAWLDARGKAPFFLYVVTDDPKRLEDRGDGGYVAAYRRSRHPKALSADGLSDEDEALIKYDAGVSVADYWVGQLVALLEVQGLRDDTLVIVTGSVGHAAAGESADGFGLEPGVLQVPTVIWHPRLRTKGRRRALTTGGDLADVSATVLALIGAEAPPDWPGMEMATALFNELALPPHPSHARVGNQVAARFGDWLLRGPGSRDLRLWNLKDDPAAKVELSGERSIALRTLRDSMQDHP